MFLDHLLTWRQKVIISAVCGGIWIYFRTAQCYDLIPRHNFWVVLGVMLWICLNYIDPLSLPIGCFILFLYAYRKSIYIYNKPILR